MPTVRGFVLKLEVGRAALVRVNLLLDTGAVQVYELHDLDADPERFNERLSKLGILRDAMNRAEPVEIETIEGNEIDRVARITRDDLVAFQNITEVIGFALNIVIYARDRTGALREEGDMSRITVVDSSFQQQELILPLQISERDVAIAQLQLIRDAQERGFPVRFLVAAASSSDDAGSAASSTTQRIIAVEMLEDANLFGDNDSRSVVSGFVESISLLRMTGGDQQNFAHIRLTTAPQLNLVGGTVPLVPFTPETLNLLVPQGSPSYALFMAGLRNNLLMRTEIIAPQQLRQPREDTTEESVEREQPRVTTAEGTTNTLTTRRENAVEMRATAIANYERGEIAYARYDKNQQFFLAFSAELNAHLASASRPVWLMISRESLDMGPVSERCVSDTPTSDLRVSTLRDLRIPYDAVWTGFACFNSGIYRFQIELPTTVELRVDDKSVCLHDAVEGQAKFGHACLHGEHKVELIIHNWICDYEFVMDVYQLR